MKIPASIRSIYDKQVEPNKRLKDEVDKRIKNLIDPRWHYESRIKELPSFALKIESGRFDNPGELEDFFACTIVVANTKEIEAAEKLIENYFEIAVRRPPFYNKTRKAAECFPFDDLRLYVRLKTSSVLPATGLESIIFEVQIKTFLQHAWSIATHHLIYKTDEANWGKDRIAYQVKAMLEHAELSIQEADYLATSKIIEKQNPKTENLSKAIILIKSHWNSAKLPNDVLRLADNILNLIGSVGITLDRLETILNSMKTSNGGNHPSNLSPYATVLQYLFHMEGVKMAAFFNQPAPKTKILLTKEIDLPPQFQGQTLNNVISV